MKSDASSSSQSVSEEDILASLNEQQRRVVTAPTDKPLFVQAAAGTGKTTTLQRRLLYLTAIQGVDPNRILTVTFTNKAADEVRQRVAKFSPHLVSSLSIATLHSFSYAIVMRHLSEAGFKTVPSLIISKARLNDFAFRAWFECRPRKASRCIAKEYGVEIRLPPRGIIDWSHPTVSNFWDNALRYDNPECTDFSHANRERLFLRKLKGKAKDVAEGLHANMTMDKNKGLGSTSSGQNIIRQKTWLTYQDILRSNRVISFDDMTMIALQLLRKHRHILKSMRDRFHYVLIDEFQDANLAQMELCLAFRTPCVTVVGDEDQSIYAFRGAVPKVFSKLQKRLMKFGFVGHTMVLELNYRSSPQIISVAKTLVRPIRKRMKRALKSVKSADNFDHIDLSRFSSDVMQAEHVAQMIVNLHTRNKEPWDQCAILLHSFHNHNDRVNVRPAHLTMQKALVKHRIPYVVRGGDSIFLGVFERVEFRDLLAYLKLSIDVHDDVAFRRALFRPGRHGLSRKSELVLHMEYLRKKDAVEISSLHDAAKKILADPSAFTERCSKALANLQDFIDRLLPTLRTQCNGCSIEVAIKHICDLIGYREFRQREIDEVARQPKPAINLVGESAKSDPGNLQLLLEVAQEFDQCWLKYAEHSRHLVEQGSFQFHPIHEFATRLSIESCGKLESTPEGVVTLSTIHQSKGLEWDNVFVPNFRADIFPKKKRRKSRWKVQDSSDEERRLYHVACMRARNKLIPSSVFRK